MKKNLKYAQTRRKSSQNSYFVEIINILFI